MNDSLPQKINKIEYGIINPETSSEEGSHWTAHYKNNDENIIFILTDIFSPKTNY